MSEIAPSAEIKLLQAVRPDRVQCVLSGDLSGCHRFARFVASVDFYRGVVLRIERTTGITDTDGECELLLSEAVALRDFLCRHLGAPPRTAKE